MSLMSISSLEMRKQPEDAKPLYTSVRFPEDIKIELKVLCATIQKPMQDAIVDAVRDYLPKLRRIAEPGRRKH